KSWTCWGSSTPPASPASRCSPKPRGRSDVRPHRPEFDDLPMTIRIGVDVGGTFTDLVAVDAASGQATHFKLPSTPADPAIAIEDGVAALLAKLGLGGEAIAFLGHGTTVVTNLII